MKPRLASSGLVRLSLQRPITMIMVFTSAVVLGFVALTRIPLELIPSGFSPPFLSISVPYDDATATDVEEKITIPLEQAVATTPGIDRITSFSSAGSARISMMFAGETDMAVAYRNVRDRVNRVRGDLPDDVQRVDVRKESGASFPVVMYGVIWEEGTDDPLDRIERYLKRPLERIDGVGVVTLWGATKKEVFIEVDRALAEAYGVDIVSLVQQLRRDNFTMASGRLMSADGRILLRSVAGFRDVDEIGELIIGGRPLGGDLRLQDIASVELRYPERSRYDRYKGKPALVLAVVKESQANTVEVCDRIKDAIEEAIEQPELSAFEVEDVFIQGDTIRFSLEQVIESGRQGGLIALLVLLFFLRRLRLTLVISLAIPLSLFLSLPVMYFTGQSINLVSLIGLMICIGLVVDNSVVVAENIARFRRRGLAPYAAAMQGAAEVALAITLATLTTVVVFLPAALLSDGTTQFFMVRMVTPVCVSLIMSLFVALVLVPLASATVLPDEQEVRRAQGGLLGLVHRADALWKMLLGRAYEATMGRLARGYTRLLRGAIRRRMDVIMVALLSLGSTIFPATQVRCVQAQSFGTRRVTINYSMPSDTTLEEAREFFLEVEEVLEDRKKELHVDGEYFGFDDTQGRVDVFLEDPAPGQPPFNEMAKAIFEAAPNRPGWVKRSRIEQSDGARDETLRIPVYGLDHDAVQRARDELEAALLRIEGVVGVHYDGGADNRRRDELSLRIERDMSERFGVPATAVANTVAWSIRGAPLPRFHTDEREVDVKVRYQGSDRSEVDQLLTYTVPSELGGRVPIQVLADRTVTQGQAVLTRFNKRVSAVVALDLEPDDRPETMARIRAFMKDYQLPEGLSFAADQRTRELDKMARDLTGALGLGTIFILLIMGFLFESFVLPLSVLPSIPLSFVGVYWFLFATGQNIDSLAGIGMVLLLGVVVNNAIVLVDFVGSARRKGVPREEAIVQAGTLRFRPIMMTALTTIGGMLPLAFTEPTGEGIPYAPFGKTLVGGMITATILTLVVVPVMYTLLDDLREAARVWWARLTRRMR